MDSLSHFEHCSYLGAGNSQCPTRRWPGGDEDFLPGICLGGALGAALGCTAASRPVAPPPMCYREVPGHWEDRWNPYSGYYERTWIPPHTESYPCR